MRWWKLGTRVVDIRNAYKILVVMSVGKRPFEDIEVDWKLKLKWFINQAIREAVRSGQGMLQLSFEH
jgi:hypothetical protein